MDTYEKKYKEALERAEALIDGETNTSDALFYLNDIKSIFPELKESEDERIRKSIIAIINNYVDNSNTFKSKMLAWLEKQGKQKSVLDELEMTLSVSEDAYLRSNLEKLIRELKG